MEKVVKHLGVRKILLDHARIGGVHVAGDGLNLSRHSFFSEHVKEWLQAFLSFPPTDPYGLPRLEIHGHGRIVMPLEDRKLVKSQMFDLRNIDVFVEMLQLELVVLFNSLPANSKIF